jgi:hypothetical protein
LGQGLHRAGYSVRIATSDNFAELVRRAGLEFYPLTADFQAMLGADRSIADQGLNVRAMARIFRERYTIWAANWVQEGLAACDGAGLLIGVSNSIMLAKALSEALGVPFAIARLQPLTLSRILPPIMLSSGRHKMPGLLSLGAHYLLFKLLWDVMCPAITASFGLSLVCLCIHGMGRTFAICIKQRSSMVSVSMYCRGRRIGRTTPRSPAIGFSMSLNGVRPMH